VIGYDTREELVCEPAKFRVRVIQREKRSSPCLPEQGVVTAPAPAQIVPQSKLANELVIEVVVQKFQQHAPVYRQCAAWATDWHLHVSRRTVNAALLAVGALLVPVVGAEKRPLLAGRYLPADETPVPCQTGETPGRRHRAYIWEYRAPGGVVVFDFQMSRGRAGPKEFRRGFQGTWQYDGYAAYDDLGEGIVYAGCLSHARRTFVDAAKVAPHDPRPPAVVARFAEIYAVERAARAAQLDAPNAWRCANSKARPCWPHSRIT
jgi:transposase